MLDLALDASTQRSYHAVPIAFLCVFFAVSHEPMGLGPCLGPVSVICCHNRSEGFTLISPLRYTVFARIYEVLLPDTHE